MSTDQWDVLRPNPQVIAAVRKAAGLSQTDAAELAGLSSYVRWSEYENGRRIPSQSLWELFLLRVGLHPTLVLHVRKGKAPELKPGYAHEEGAAVTHRSRPITL